MQAQSLHIVFLRGSTRCVCNMCLTPPNKWKENKSSDLKSFTGYRRCQSVGISVLWRFAEIVGGGTLLQAYRQFLRDCDFYKRTSLKDGWALAKQFPSSDSMLLRVWVVKTTDECRGHVPRGVVKDFHTLLTCEWKRWRLEKDPRFCFTVSIIIQKGYNFHCIEKLAWSLGNGIFPCTCNSFTFIRTTVSN